jgi:hypothetical protein
MGEIRLSNSPYIITSSNPLDEDKCPKCGSVMYVDKDQYFLKCARCEKENNQLLNQTDAG